MSVGIGGCKLQGGLVGLNGFLHPAGFIQYVAQVEVRQGIPWIGLDGLTVVPLRQRKVLAVVVKRTEINVGRGVIGFDRQHSVVFGDGFALGGGIFFKSDAAGKTGGRLSLPDTRLGSRDRRRGDYLLAGREIHQELAGNRLEKLAIVAKGYSPLTDRK